MKELAKVLENKGDKSLVRIEKSSACSKCESQCGLADNSHEIDELEVLVDDPLHSQPGSTVMLEMGAKPVLTASLLIYLVPIIGLFIGYFLGSEFLGALLNSGEIAGILGSVIGLIFSFALVKLLDGFLGQHAAFKPRITRIISH